MGVTQDLDQPDLSAATAGLWDNRSNYDASGNVYPSTGGSGTSGAILKSDQWRISVAGTLGGTAVSVGDVLVALVDTPGSTSSNWMVLQGNVVAFTGDSGSGGSEGLVPAPAAGDAAANKFLKANGQWVAVSSSNIGTNDLTISDNTRYLRLPAGYSSSQYFQIQNTGGENFIKFLGDGTVQTRGQYFFNAAVNGGQELYVIRAKSQGGFEKFRVQAEDNQGIVDIWGNQSYQLISLNSTSTSYFYNSLIVGDATIDASALFQVKSTSKGFLPPVMSATQAEAISSPAEGLMVYSTNGTGTTITSKGWWGYDGTSWNKLN